LNLARSGQRGAAVDLVNIAGVTRGRVDAWRQVASQSGVALDVEGDAIVLSVTDRTILESALDAVIDNAVKFSPAGARVAVSVCETAENYEITVRDHGPGVDADELAHLTDRFWRSPRNRSMPGSGLGLAIASDLLHSLGGKLRVESPHDGGLAVRLTFTNGEFR